MHFDLNDTIVAVSSASGAGARAVVRLSGPAAVRIVRRFAPTLPLETEQRRFYETLLWLPDLRQPLPADVYVWPAPRTYTGQPMAEVHTLASPPLVEALVAHLLSAGARAARPGEFTLRAFLAGKLDLTRAEAVLAVIEAGSRDELRQALAQLAGGIARPLQELRGDLLDLLADIEAGLDFAEEDIAFVRQEEMLRRITKGLALITNLRQQLDRRALSERPFRAVLAGPPNAGKSSLFNAVGGSSALVSPLPGTTRDYLVQRLHLDGVTAELMDTAGLQGAASAVEEQAQALASEQIAQADLILLCAEAGSAAAVPPLFAGKDVVRVATKCDLASAPPDHLATSAKTGLGIAGLRSLLRQRAQVHSRPALAPSLARCRGHVDGCLEHLRRAHALVLEEELPELVALELRGALDQLGEMAGTVYTDDLLDRIFSRFCIGK